MAIVTGLLFLIIRFFFLRSNFLPTKMFIQALKAENDGQFEEATVLYENALVEVKKIRFHLVLQKKIADKLKLLMTIKKYNSCQHFIRESNSWLSS
ncbi:MAG TPA: hypothetical protein VEZ55_06400 [Chitinophagaceae bacterium]|nr:hypothetical protein [Chitinophagaceae bacterium]